MPPPSQGGCGRYSASYSYNGAGTRIAKTEGGVPNVFKRDGVGVTAPVLADSYARYTPGVSESRGSTPSTSVTKYMHSGIKSADAQTNASQTIDATRKYDAFGAVLGSTGTWSGPFGNAGKFGYQEDSTGYQLLGHRYYDPSTGRFLTRDPIQDGRNWYVYCENQPTMRADATGLVPPVIVAAIVVVGLTLVNPANAPTGPDDTGDHSAGQAHNEWVAGELIGLFVGGLSKRPRPNFGSDAPSPGIKPKPSTGKEPGVYEGSHQKDPRPYVGESENVPGRYDGPHHALDTDRPIVFTPVSGNRRDRQVAEQNRINELGGLEHVSNRRNPVAEKYWEELGVKPVVRR